MDKLLCQINDEGFTEKPTDIRFYGALRDKMIQKPWTCIEEDDFVDKVTRFGHAFYGNIFDGHDLMEHGRQRECWRAQTLVGVDIDKTTADPQDMCWFYTQLGYLPWMAYPTFSDDEDGLRSYRLLWKVEVDHNVSYEQWADVIKGLSTLTEYGDKHARDCTRMWQGSDKGPCWWIWNSSKYSYGELAGKLGLT